MNHFQMMMRFNRWVNGRLYESVARLADEDYHRDIGLFFGSVHATLNHILLVDIAWRSRIEGVPHGFTSLDQILHADFARLGTARIAEDEKLVALVDRLSDADLDRVVVYTRLLGSGEEEMRARHILATLNNHQTHHRGQVHAALTQAGIEPPGLDIGFFLDGTGDSGPTGTIKN
jgi:uncharacterized damage-inducible protein DinB